MNVRIYQVSKSAMQSGRAGTDMWVMAFEPQATRQLEPLMGWTSSSDTRVQTNLYFSSLKEAQHYAQSRGYAYTCDMPKNRVIKPRSYSDNFSASRILRWTH